VNRFETLKQTKDGLDVLDDIPQFARDGFDSIPEDDLERLKWAGMFHRKPTKPYFMMRIRFPNGIATAEQIRAVATLITTHGRSIADLTTRQQIEPRWLPIEAMPAIQDELAAAGLTSLQTGMDNVRGVVGCPLAGLHPGEVVDASPVCRDFQSLFVGDRAFTNLPRKFNVAITGCPDNCIDAESQDVALVPAVQRTRDGEVAGFNVLVGGKMGSGGFRLADSLDVFVEPPDAAVLCRELVLLFRDHGPRETRSRARFAFLIEDRGISWVRDQLEERLRRNLPPAGDDARSLIHADHMGIRPQRQPEHYAVGIVVPVGRVTATQLTEIARLADAYGHGELRLTTEQNVVIPHVPASRVDALLAEPLLQEWRPNADQAIRGLVACTGTDFCNLALIETKSRALQTSRSLAGRLPPASGTKIRWSGCPAACGNHHAADIGLQGKRIRTQDGRVVEAVTISVGGRTGPGARPGRVVREDVLCDEQLPDVLAAVIHTEVTMGGFERVDAMGGGRP
jgi:ferredoxin-nitrite reductase